MSEVSLSEVIASLSVNACLKLLVENSTQEIDLQHLNCRSTLPEMRLILCSVYLYGIGYHILSDGSCLRQTHVYPTFVTIAIVLFYYLLFISIVCNYKLNLTMGMRVQEKRTQY